MRKLNALLLTFAVALPSVALADRPTPPRDHRHDHRDHDHGRRRPPQRITLTGSYTSEFGPVQLEQREEIVTGTFSAGGGGNIEGRIVGDQVQFRWWNTKERGRGVWYMANPNKIVGTWGKRRSTTNGGKWNLRRL